MYSKRQWGFVLIAAAFFLSACTSHDQDETASDSTAMRPVSLQLQWVTQAQFAGYYMAFEKGWYREKGIDLTIKPGGPDIVPVDTVVTGTAEFGTTLLSDLVVAIEKKSPVVSIAQIQQKNGLLLIARKSSGIAHPKDFAGRKVGVWLGSWEAQFNALLAREKVSADTVKIMSQGWSMKPFVQGKLEVASAMIYNEYQMVLASGISPQDLNIIDYADFDLAFPGDVLFTTNQMISADPDLCARMVRVSLRGWQYAMDHPEEAVDIVLKHDTSGVQTRAHQLAMMKEITKLVRVPGRRIGSLDESTLNRMVELLVQYRILGNGLPPRQIFTDKFLG